MSWGLSPSLSESPESCLAIEVLESGKAKGLCNKIENMIKHCHVETVIVLDLDVNGGDGVLIQLWVPHWDQESYSMKAIKAFEAVSYRCLYSGRIRHDANYVEGTHQ